MSLSHRTSLGGCKKLSLALCFFKYCILYFVLAFQLIENSLILFYLEKAFVFRPFLLHLVSFSELYGLGLFYRLPMGNILDFFSNFSLEFSLFHLLLEVVLSLEIVADILELHFVVFSPELLIFFEL